VKALAKPTYIDNNCAFKTAPNIGNGIVEFYDVVFTGCINDWALKLVNVEHFRATPSGLEQPRKIHAGKS